MMPSRTRVAVVDIVISGEIQDKNGRTSCWFECRRCVKNDFLEAEAESCSSKYP